MIKTGVDPSVEARIVRRILDDFTDLVVKTSPNTKISWNQYGRAIEISITLPIASSLDTETLRDRVDRYAAAREDHNG